MDDSEVPLFWEITIFMYCIHTAQGIAWHEYYSMFYTCQIIPKVNKYKVSRMPDNPKYSPELGQLVSSPFLACINRPFCCATRDRGRVAQRHILCTSGYVPSCFFQFSWSHSGGSPMELESSGPVIRSVARHWQTQVWWNVKRSKQFLSGSQLVALHGSHALRAKCPGSVPAALRRTPVRWVTLWIAAVISFETKLFCSLFLFWTMVRCLVGWNPWPFSIPLDS